MEHEDDGGGPLPPPPLPSLVNGMSFADSKAAFYAVQDYALARDKQVKVASRGGKHRRLVCTSSSPCPFFVQLYLHNSKTNRTWYVSSSALTHAAACTSVGKPTKRQIVEMAAFKSAVQQTPHVTAAHLLSNVVEGKAHLRTIYRAKEEMKRVMVDKLSATNSKIPALLAAFMAVNPESLAIYERDPVDSNTFTKVFIACSIFTRTTAFNQQIYALECLPFVNKECGFKGVQLFLLGKDGNMQTITLAAAVVCGAATQRNYRWFLECVTQAGVDLRICPILCAMEPELLALEVELGLTFRYCTRFLIEQELSSLSGFNRHHHGLIWELQQSQSEDEFHARLQWIGTTCGSTVETYLRHIPMERWVVAGNIHKISLYGWRSRNFFEADDGDSDVREQDGESRTRFTQLFARLRQTPSLFAFLEQMMLHAMEAAFERNDLATKWKRAGRIVTPHAEALYEAQSNRIGEYHVTQASDTVCFVHKNVANTAYRDASQRRRRVDLASNTCSCPFIGQFAIPCRHLIAVLVFCQQMDTVYGRFASGYLVSNYALAFQGKSVELPLENNSSANLQNSEERWGVATDSRTFAPRCASTRSIIAASAMVSARRKRVKRPRTDLDRVKNGIHGESDTSLDRKAHSPAFQKARLCKNCRRPGHNVRSCASQPPRV